ncbi:cysteine-rich with EGF-like domain protein 2 isoform X5 [Periplaneta americana]|uniref:cysteine-rich with EGF-like domain protein 2 isoform X5 n=1 Tax=Periplaneta americana TaxID=6978 RepID=UPI0037E87CBE
MVMTVDVLILFLVLSLTILIGNSQDPNIQRMKENLHAVKLPPCQACKVLVESFKKEMERTARGKFEGGDAAWEEERLGSYSHSEVRLVEIQEKLCTNVERGKDQCHALSEETEQYIDDWWFSKQDVDLYTFLCIKTLKHCCPDNHYGADCKPCPGFPSNICNKSGKCKGAGTRKGNGKCSCEAGYMGELCNSCASEYYESYRDEDKLLCSPCHSSCQGSCTQAGPKGCSVCKPGWFMDTEKGCLDVNECFMKPNPCTRNEFCVNNDGSYTCLACDKACESCQGDGPDMCDKCAEGYSLKDNICVGRPRYVLIHYASHVYVSPAGTSPTKTTMKKL